MSTTKSPLVVPNLNEKTQEVENYINELNNMIETLTLKLTSSTSQEERNSILKTIETIEPIRTNLTKTLNGMYSYYTQNVSSATNVLQQQKQAMEIINSELENAKSKLDYINQQKINKMRLIEINDYYSEEYAEYTKLLQYFIYMLIPIIVLSLLQKNGFISSNILGVFVVIIVLAAIYFIFPVIISILSRDNMIYSQYRWNFNKSLAPKVELNTHPSSNSYSKSSKTPDVCVGEECCTTGFKWNAVSNKCEPIGSSSYASDIVKICSPSPEQKLVQKYASAMSKDYLGQTFATQSIDAGNYIADQIAMPTKISSPSARESCKTLQKQFEYACKGNTAPYNITPRCSSWWDVHGEMLANCNETVPKSNVCTRRPGECSYAYSKDNSQCSDAAGIPCEPGCCSKDAVYPNKPLPPHYTKSCDGCFVGPGSHGNCYNGAGLQCHSKCPSCKPMA